MSASALKSTPAPWRVVVSFYLWPRGLLAADKTNNTTCKFLHIFFNMITFYVGKEDLKGDLVHPKGTLALRISGLSANRATATTLLLCLSLAPRDAEALYRFENPFVWFLKTNEDKRAQ